MFQGITNLRTFPVEMDAQLVLSLTGGIVILFRFVMLVYDGDQGILGLIHCSMTILIFNEGNGGNEAQDNHGGDNHQGHGQENQGQEGLGMPWIPDEL